MGCVVALAAAQAAPAPASSAAKPEEAKLDRSGEARLRGLVAAWSAQKNVHITAARFTTSDGDFHTRGGNFDLYVKSNTEFRLATSSIWSDAFLAVQDGKTMIVDNLDSSPIGVYNPVKSVGELGGYTSVAEHFSPVMALMSPADKFDEVALPKDSITLKPVGASEQIEFKHPKLGILRLTVQGNSVLVGERIREYGDARLARVRDVYRTAANTQLRPWMFVARIEPGARVNDTRKKTQLEAREVEILPVRAKAGAGKKAADY
jgi:hypothetical protein